MEPVAFHPCLYIYRVYTSFPEDLSPIRKAEGGLAGYKDRKDAVLPRYSRCHPGVSVCQRKPQKKSERLIINAL